MLYSIIVAHTSCCLLSQTSSRLVEKWRATKWTKTFSHITTKFSTDRLLAVGRLKPTWELGKGVNMYVYSVPVLYWNPILYYTILYWIKYKWKVTTSKNYLFSDEIELSPKYTELAILCCIAYIVKSKIISVKLKLGPLVINSDTYLTELTWQVLIAGYLTFFGAPIDCWLLDLDDLGKINRAWGSKMSQS